MGVKVLRLMMRQHLYETITISLHPASVTRLGNIASCPRKSRFVRRVVFEDLFPITTQQLEQQHPDLRLADHVGVGPSYDSHRRHLLWYRNQQNTRLTVCQAVASLPNIESLEFYSGFWDLPAPVHPPGLNIVGDLLRPHDGTPTALTQYGVRLWEDRGTQQIFQTPPKSELLWLDQSVQYFNDIMYATMTHPQRTQKLGLKFDTVHYRALERGPLVVPHGSIRQLHIRYRCDMSAEDAFVDMETMADHVVFSTGYQFDDLEELTLVGKSYKEPIRFSDTNFPFPTLDSLQYLSLTNVAMEDYVIDWATNKAVDLHIHNIIVCEVPGEVERFAGPNQLMRRAKFHGLIAQSRSNTGVETRGAFSLDDVWIVGSKEAARRTAKLFWPLVFRTEFPARVGDVRRVSPGQVEHYVLNGGPNPFTRQNMWMRSNISSWDVRE